MFIVAVTMMHVHVCFMNSCLTNGLVLVEMSLLCTMQQLCLSVIDFGIMSNAERALWNSNIQMVYKVKFNINTSSFIILHVLMDRDFRS